MPSHDPAYRRVVDSIVGVHQRDLLAAGYFIIDLRGNEGGGALTSRALEPYIASERKRPSPHETIKVLVLNAIRSERALVIGEPTAGALDYMSATIVSFSPRERRWALGYPTMTAHSNLPRGGMRGIGIAPDVHLSWRTVTDPVAEAVRLLDNGGSSRTSARTSGRTPRS